VISSTAPIVTYIGNKKFNNSGCPKCYLSTPLALCFCVDRSVVFVLLVTVLLLSVCIYLVGQAIPGKSVVDMR